MAILLEKTRIIVSRIVHFIDERVEVLREKLDGFLGTYPVYQGLVYTEEEKEMIDQTTQLLEEFFPERPGQLLAQEDYESRCEAVEDFAMQLIELYGLTCVEVVITNEQEQFRGKDAIFTYGFAAVSEKKVYINANCLESEDPLLLEHIVSTVVHELRHLIQYQVARMEKTYGVSYDRRHAWRANMVNYIKAEYDMEGYFNQPIEFDARNFTNRIWRGAYGICVQ